MDGAGLPNFHETVGNWGAVTAVWDVPEGAEVSIEIGENK
jgi:hypothetical protein